MKLFIVESPSKARKIQKWLGPEYCVLASKGHIRDLVEKTDSVSTKDFSFKWKTKKTKEFSEILEKAKKANPIILATDPDREGEAIAWHLKEMLEATGIQRTYVRCVFNSITKTAIERALTEVREIDQSMVDSYLARRGLDFLYGFHLSPVLWRKLPGSKSAGRVQSTALRLICEKELEREQFEPQKYWTVDADFKINNEIYSSSLYQIEGRKIDRFQLSSHIEDIRTCDLEYAVSEINRKETKEKPKPPFTTSTLQQQALYKLGFSAKRTMNIAQKLYQSGHITYMRTDSMTINPSFVSGIRDFVSSAYNASYIPEKPRFYRNKKGAQEAHEAIRTTSLNKPRLTADEFKLYDLIWKRTIASQMSDAIVYQDSIHITGGKYVYRHSQRTVHFPGYLRIWGKIEEALPEKPQISSGAVAERVKLDCEEKSTEAPARFNEASLVKELEKLGIGRPSTYANIISTIQEREYAIKEGRQLIPTDKGRLVTAFLKKFFETYVDYEFTSNMESRLDEISDSNTSFKEVLESFWKDFDPTIQEVLKKRNREVLDALNETLGSHLFKEGSSCPKCKKPLSLKIGKHGAFVGCTGYPSCEYIRSFSNSEKENQDIDLGEDILVKKGRYGYYVQQGEKKASLGKKLKPENITLEKALELLSQKKSSIITEFGKHKGKDLALYDGQYGPYVKWGRKNYGLKKLKLELEGITKEKIIGALK